MKRTVGPAILDHAQWWLPSQSNRRRHRIEAGGIGLDGDAVAAFACCLPARAPVRPAPCVARWDQIPRRYRSLGSQQTKGFFIAQCGHPGVPEESGIVARHCHVRVGASLGALLSPGNMSGADHQLLKAVPARRDFGEAIKQRLCHINDAVLLKARSERDQFWWSIWSPWSLVCRI